MLHFLVWQMAMGIKFKTDPSLVKLGYRGVDAYAMDENGDYIEEAVRRPNLKMMRFYLAWKRPDTWGKHPKKRDSLRTGGVLVVGGRSAKSENSLRRKHQSQEVEVDFEKGSGTKGLAASGNLLDDTIGSTLSAAARPCTRRRADARRR